MGYTINAEHISIGKFVTIEDGVYIGNKFGKKAHKVIIGDGVHIGHNSRFYYPNLEIGDYTDINNHAFGSGDMDCKIGSCCWFGQNCILDSEGGLEIHNGVGVGAYSQLWSHIKFGDVLEGCRWDQRKKLTIEEDVWLVGHCIVSPITAEKKSMAMVGSVVTKDMKANHIYAGTPAKDMTEIFGNQYQEKSVDEKFSMMVEKYNEFLETRPEYKPDRNNIEIIKSAKAIQNSDEISYFNVEDRTYNKLLTQMEYDFMKFLLVQIKFYPRQ
ncbi:hypothetical protein [Salinimicrobium terrae]|uniref:hypothetical protein n=1 Tax=Salinimicrobium terrae TaxID=470866 RepID=UPI0003FF49FF|nr:hypothetical protein [Salinimicrobium terrae]